MIILVLDVAAEVGGAASVLRDFYKKVSKDQKNSYIFLLSTYCLDETNNIKVLNYKWIKKSWFHRLYFDYFIAQRVVKEYEVDHILSLQNTIIPRTKVAQTVYEHNVIPFCDVKFKLFDTPILWIYQNFIANLIKHSLKKANCIIVQTQWMKTRISNELKIPTDKIVIMRLEISNSNITEMLHRGRLLNNFFYPASEQIFKNHNVIIEACKELKEKNITNYTISFTLTGNENKQIKKLKKLCDDMKLPIEWIGWLDTSSMIKYYLNSILIFPSYLETVGLPLLEAINFKAPIIAADLEYSRETLGNYENVDYFDAFSSRELTKILLKHIQ